LSDGYFYDSESTLSGCWEDVKPDIKIGVERCGCDGGMILGVPVWTVLLTTLLLVARIII